MTSSMMPGEALRVALGPHRNNAAFLASGVSAADGFDGFDGFGRAYPAEELGEAAALLDLPDGFGHGVADNIACEGQVLVLHEPVWARGLEVVGAGSGGTVSETLLLLPEAEGDEPGVRARVELSDFLSRRPVFDDTGFAHSPFLYDVGGRPEPGAEPRLWRSSVRFATPVRCGRITLPVNPDLHVVGVWLLPVSADPAAAARR